MKNIYLSMATMAAKMNSETHKVIVARYQGPEILYAVPKDWDPEKVRIRYGAFYYDGEEVNPPSFETEPDSKFPIEVEDGSNDFDLDSYFDCEEERYCDNEKCPYEGYCFGELKEQFKGKPYICEGCSTGIGVQEKEEEVRTCCEKCEGEGMVLVSKERAKELKEQELLEGLCPFGDKCAGESEEDKAKKWDLVCEYWNDRKNREGDFLDYMCDTLGFKMTWSEESDSDAEDYFEKRDEVEDAMLKRFIVPQWYKKKHIVEKCKEQGLSDSDVEEVIDFLKTQGHKDVDQMVDELIEERKK